MVESKMLDWFDFRKFKVYHWLKVNSLGLLRSPQSPNTAGPRATENGWKERKDAEAAINAYLAESPSVFLLMASITNPLLILPLKIATITFVHGPQGSGKTAMLDTVLKQSDRYSNHSNYIY